MKNNLVFFTGSGNTGKTSVLEVLKNNIDKKTETYITSITREFYKSNNVNSEVSFNNLPDKEKYEFQFRLLSFYINKFREVTKENKDYFVDRSIIDHFAYTIYYSKNVLNKQDYNKLEKMVFDFFYELQNRFFITIYFFPFPTPWSLNDGSSDGFRDDSFIKNIIIDSLMNKMCCNLVINNSLNLNIIHVPLYDENTNELLSPKERYEFMLDISSDLLTDSTNGIRENLFVLCPQNVKKDKITIH